MQGRTCELKLIHWDQPSNDVSFQSLIEQLKQLIQYEYNATSRLTALIFDDSSPASSSSRFFSSSSEESGMAWESEFSYIAWLKKKTVQSPGRSEFLME